MTGPQPTKGLFNPFSRVVRALIELAGHLIVVIGLLAGIRLIEWVVHWL